MFKSARRPIATPQREHLKLAGALALLWGDKDFDCPPAPAVSLLSGTGLHDRAYGPVDSFAVGEYAEDDRFALTRTGFYLSRSDHVRDVIVKLRLKHLVSHQESPAHRAPLAEMERVIRDQLQRDGLDAATFQRIDRIAALCDGVSFDFRFEAWAEGADPVFPPNEHDMEVVVRYRIAEGSIHVDPWPFSVDRYVNCVIGYPLDGYPATLDPIIIPFQLMHTGY